MTQPVDPQAIKQQVKQDWDLAAPAWRKYDAHLAEVNAPVTERLLSLAGLALGHRVLDIACGTGEPALPAAEVVGPAGYVLGTDLSEEMLAVAREKAQTRGLNNVEFRQVDGEEMDVETSSFDAVTCRWGIMFMPEPVRCLRQAHDALKPGGRIALSVWGPPERNPSFVLPAVILRKHLQGPPPDLAAPGGVFSLADRGRLASKLAEAGFRDVQIDDLELPIAVFDSGEEYWRFIREVAAPVAAFLAQLPAAEQETVGREIATAAAAGDPNGRVSLNGYTLLGSAVK